jgi:spore germination protein GerM
MRPQATILLLASLILAACGDAAREPEPGHDAGQPPAAGAMDTTPRDPGQPTPPENGTDQTGTLTVRVHFTRDEEPEPVEREIQRAPGVLRSALEAQLRGPTAAERAAGLFSWFSERTAGMLRDVRLDEAGRAIVDFHDFTRTISGASSSAGSRILLNELNHTVFQFESVRSVEYRIDGSCDAFWNWLQAECTVVPRP